MLHLLLLVTGACSKQHVLYFPLLQRLRVSGQMFFVSVFTVAEFQEWSEIHVLFNICGSTYYETKHGSTSFKKYPGSLRTYRRLIRAISNELHGLWHTPILTKQLSCSSASWRPSLLTPL